MQRLAAGLRGAALAALALAALAAPAGAQTVAPPGNSGVDQYFEVVPSAGGDAHPTGERRVLPQSVSSGLASQGAAGRRTQRVIEQTAPPPVHVKPRKRERPQEVRPAPRPDSTISSAVKSLSGEQDAGGMGLLLPALLVASSMFLVLLALRRRRAV